MNFYIGNTDQRWFRFLQERQPEDVNFWKPGGGSGFKAIRPGEPFLLRLKAPINAIAGVGFFVKQTFLPLSFAWEAFEERNGAASPEELRTLINNYRKERSPDPRIGCIILTSPVFFEEADWIPDPPDWKKNIVQGKTYDSSEEIGKRIWSDVQTRLERYQQGGELKESDRFAIDEPIPEGYSQSLQKVRLGQGSFRVMVTDAYDRRCSITGEKTLPTLEASHIKPYSRSGPHQVQNGILLRSDIHRLFDLGYLTITPDHHVEVSKRIKEEYNNGKEYYRFHGQPLNTLPEHRKEQPDPGYIAYHNERIFQR